MNKIKIYTKGGDGGETHLYGSKIVSKDDPRIEAVGALDELNSIIGVTINFVHDHNIKKYLNKIQNDLFQAGADLAGSSVKGDRVPRITIDHVKEMEEKIDHIDSNLGIQQKFVLPGGTPASSFLHLCRTIARRAERNLVNVSKIINLNPDLLKYVNRLSDLLYIFARYANKEIIKEQHPLYKYFKK